MPDITSSGTYTKDTAGYEFLGETRIERRLIFAGSSIGTSLKIQYKDDQGTFRDLTNGDITSLPTDKTINIYADLQIVSVGSPNLNVTDISLQQVIN